VSGIFHFFIKYFCSACHFIWAKHQRWVRQGSRHQWICNLMGE
jgi:hypothetical protein